LKSTPKPEYFFAGEAGSGNQIACLKRARPELLFASMNQPGSGSALPMAVVCVPPST
jgi:hypothetical protein